MAPPFLAGSLRIRNTGATTWNSPWGASVESSSAGSRASGTLLCSRFQGRGRSKPPPCPHATSQPSTTASTNYYSNIVSTRARSPRCSGASSSSRRRSASSESIPSARRPVTCYSEIPRRKCRRCGTLTRDLAAVLTPTGWRELCFWCRQPFLSEAAPLSDVRVPGQSPGSDRSNGAA